MSRRTDPARIDEAHRAAHFAAGVVTAIARRRIRLRALVASLLLGVAVVGCATTPGVPPAPSGASAPGSVDIRKGGGGTASTETTVCTFFFDFMLNANSSGTYRVETQHGGQVVMNGTWATGAAPTVRVPAAPDILSLPAGQYAVTWTQNGAAGGVKPFAVACPGAG